MLPAIAAYLYNSPLTLNAIVLKWEPTARASEPTQIESSTSAPVEEVDLGWVTTNRRAPQSQSKSKSKSRAEEPSAILSDEDEDDDDDVDEMGEIEVDVKRAEQKRVEKDLRREANVSLECSLFL